MQVLDQTASGQDFSGSPDRPQDGAQGIDRVARLDRKTFAARYFRARKPVIITDMATHWPAVQKWSFDFFAGLDPDRQVTLETGNVLQDETNFETAGIADYLSKLEQEGGATPKGDKKRYLSMFRIFEQFPHLKADVDFSLIEALTMRQIYFGWLGPAGTLTYPDYSYESNTFDANSNLKTWRKRDGKTLTHYYDAINAKTSTAVPGEYTLNFDYDGLGRPKLSTRHNSSVGYTYDDLGRLKTTTTNGRALTYEYDDAGRRSKLKHPDSFYVNYTYDSTGALTSIKEKNNKVLASYGYDNYGRLTTVNRNNGNGAVSSLGYNNVGQVQNFDHVNINNASFKYNPASQMVNRVVSNANFQMKIPTINQENYEVNNLNQYDSVGSQNISYDNTGNLTNFNGWVYNYNAHNRLTSAARFGQSLVLTYDPTGRLESSSCNKKINRRCRLF